MKLRWTLATLAGLLWIASASAQTGFTPRDESPEEFVAAPGREETFYACIACHGPQGRGNSPAAYPALRAQHAVYTYNQLRAFASGGRKSAGNEIMQVIASRLTDDEMRALASYTQGLR